MRNRWRYAIGTLAIPSIIGGIAVLDSHPNLAYALFVFAGISFIWGIWPLVFRKHQKKRTSQKVITQTPLPKINYEKLREVTPQDKKAIELMDIRMTGTHGHMDLTGLLSDRASGIPLNDLIEKPCSKCGVQRNKRGKRV
jgi:hypothetical protein